MAESKAPVSPGGQRGEHLTAGEGGGQRGGAEHRPRKGLVLQAGARRVFCEDGRNKRPVLLC